MTRRECAIDAALLRCEKTSLGNYLPRTDADAKLLHDAGLAWTPNHWWHPLNIAGVRRLWSIDRHMDRSRPETPIINQSQMGAQ